ncbi:unnamed protein product [Clonostachys rhizophaga]|uniref:Major facilitator superfamily (MFS) profile domain-containing protein n=1 Tax=Clonostachys rhizophaga TaxID=160324 RepID=A0A9N9VMW6_9HYPO|nr:unnamed protein product [Clonostachys rhizophaga]
MEYSKASLDRQVDEPTSSTSSTAAKAVGAELASMLPRHDKPWFRQRNLLQLNFLLLFVILTPTSLGFDASMMNALMSLETWNNYFGTPRGALLGFMNAVMPLGTIIGSLPAGWTSDKIGRKKTIMLGLVVLIMAGILQGCSRNIAAFIVARFFVGIGIEFTAAPSPVLISELAYPAHRGKMTSLFQCFFYLGAIASSWITFGTSSMKGSEWSWRIPSILQVFFPIVQIVGLYFVPESPRWLIAKGRLSEARATFAKYHAAGDDSHPLVDYEMSEITSHIETERAVAGMGWLSLVRTKADRKRMAICVFSAFISNWSGNGIITYYLSLVLESVGITDSFTKTLINGVLQIFNFFAATGAALLVDRVGRRPLWIASCAGMLITYIILTVLSAEFVKTSHSGVGIGVIVTLFLYFFHYDIAVTPLTFAYPTEIFPFHARQKGMAVVMLVNGVCGMTNTFVNPIALGEMGWRYYIVYIALLAIMLTFVVLFFAETKGHSLEEIADIFEGPFLVIGRSKRRLTGVSVHDEEGSARCGQSTGVGPEAKGSSTAVAIHKE